MATDDPPFIEIDMALERQGLAHAFVLGGEVVEVSERDGVRFARVVASVPVVLNVPADHQSAAPDVQLGDQVVIEGTITVHGARSPSAVDEWTERG